MVLLERELWPNFLHQAQALGVPVALVNARLSERSAAGYARWRGLMRPALATLRLVCAEDAATAGRLAALGVKPERLKVTGNIKSDGRPDPVLPQRIAQLRQALGQRPVLAAGSTHLGEDEALLAAFADHLALFPQTLLVLVPRHPERFGVVAALLQQSGLRFVRHSLGQAPQADTQVLLGDTMGELMLWYGVADACFVGGSLITRGGHNPLEVLSLDKPLIAGPHTANFEPIYTALQAAGALLPAPDARAVFARFQSLLRDRNQASDIATRGRAVYLRMAGATAATMEHLQPWLSDGPPPGSDAATVVQDGGHQVWFDPRCFTTGGVHLFDPAWWRQQGVASSDGAGRGRVHWVADGRRVYLLRHYYRGGLMARLSRDLFLAQPVPDTRAMREFTLLGQLRRRRLPVPRACAARHARHALWYRADILVERIPDATDVAAILHTQRALSTPQWNALGRVVRQLHDAQVWHADLNCHNLMLDIRGKAWIVDFDKCGFRTGDAWKCDNLERLLRSLRKELRLDPGFRWSEKDWPHFLTGYRPDTAA